MWRAEKVNRSLNVKLSHLKVSHIGYIFPVFQHEASFIIKVAEKQKVENFIY